VKRTTRFPDKDIINSRVKDDDDERFMADVCSEMHAGWALNTACAL
jgi:hypothetical protein